jgi:hypothetical protein
MSGSRQNRFSNRLVHHPDAVSLRSRNGMATTKGETVEEREEAVPELLLLEPEILAWLESTDRNVGNDSSPTASSTETSTRGQKEDA